MKWFILLISTLTVVQNRPQNSPQVSDPTVQLEKQTIIELNPNPFRKQPDNTPQPARRKVEENTKEILQKIAELNKKQGLTQRKERPNYFHFPFSYSRSQDEKKSYNRQTNYFTFPNNPFSNPIFDYLERERHGNGGTQLKTDINSDNRNNGQIQYEKSMIGQPAIGVTKEDLVPNQYVKRKIVHQQTILMPNPNFMQPPQTQMMPQNMSPYEMPISPMNLEQIISPSSLSNDNKEEINKTDSNKILSNLEKQTVDNVRNIVSSSQQQAFPLLYNPYYQYIQRYAPSQYSYDPLNSYNELGTPLNRDAYNFQNYGPYGITNVEQGRQNWNWPGASYFPIYIRDPFLQIYNAITSMVEYGPSAGQNSPCKRPNKNRIKTKEESSTREAKTTNEFDEKGQITFEIGEKNTPQISIYGFDGNGDKTNSSYLDIENINIGANNENTLKFTVNLKSDERESKDTESGKALKTSWDKIIDSGNPNTNKSIRSSSKHEKVEESKDFRPSLFFKPQIVPPTTVLSSQPPVSTTVSPPVRGSVVHKIEADDDFDEDEKAEEISISNDGNKKLFSRDNTGSGIFIHKLKVRKGGVAIAGPGGIATAGSGGTAIVGPNGIAYTHPDSLAIAGSGTKVVAVDPKINLADLISNSNGSKPSAEGFPPSRVGRVVAVGPVVYYNRG